MIDDSNYIHLEGLHIRNSGGGVDIRDWGSGGDGTFGNVVRGNYITDIDVGISARSNGNSGPGHNDLYIVDNVLEGKNVFGDLSSATWNDEGITTVGQNIEVAYNTLSGFGDSLGLQHTDRTKSVDIHHNYVIYGGDDGVELDFGVRNVVARHNLLTNTGDGVSTQYIQDGPGYSYKNLIYNVDPFRGPFKIKPEAECNSGVFHFNNTSVNAGRAWINFSGCGSDINLYNNLFTGDTTESDILRLDSSHWSRLAIDYNAYIYDGFMQFSDAFYTSFASYQNGGRWGANDVLLEGEQIFRNASIFPEQSDGSLGTQRSPEGLDFRLASGSSAIDAAKILPTITDGYAGNGPDIGAYESNQADISYGARIAVQGGASGASSLVASAVSYIGDAFDRLSSFFNPQNRSLSVAQVGGTGTLSASVIPTSLGFGSVDVGDSLTQVITLTAALLSTVEPISTQITVEFDVLDAAQNITIEVEDSETNQIVYSLTTTAQGGDVVSASFEADPSRTYNIVITSPGFLTQTLSSTTLDETIQLPVLYAGDLNGDGAINSLDWSEMAQKWNQNDEVADLNRDGVVNSVDFSFMRRNWNKQTN
jgi:hypothetical protein